MAFQTADAFERQVIRTGSHALDLFSRIEDALCDIEFQCGRLLMKFRSKKGSGLGVGSAEFSEHANGEYIRFEVHESVCPGPHP